MFGAADQQRAEAPTVTSGSLNVGKGRLKSGEFYGIPIDPRAALEEAGPQERTAEQHSSTSQASLRRSAVRTGLTDRRVSQLTGLIPPIVNGGSPAQARWATPEHRAKMAAAAFRLVTAEDRRRNPDKWSRHAILAGMTRAEAEKAWAQAERQADTAVRGLDACGAVPATVVTDSDEAIANMALHGLAMIAFGPSR